MTDSHVTLGAESSIYVLASMVIINCKLMS